MTYGFGRRKWYLRTQKVFSTITVLVRRAQIQELQRAPADPYIQSRSVNQNKGKKEELLCNCQENS